MALTKGHCAAIIDGNAQDDVTVTSLHAGDRVFGTAHVDTAAGGTVTTERDPSRCFRLPTTATIAAGAEIVTTADGNPTTQDRRRRCCSPSCQHRRVRQRDTRLAGHLTAVPPFPHGRGSPRKPS